MNALISITEINSLYDQRPIVEKQASYAFVHPFAEAFGGIVSDIPVKFVSAVVFNIISGVNITMHNCRRGMIPSNVIRIGLVVVGV